MLILAQIQPQINFLLLQLLLDKVKDPATRDRHIFYAANFPCNFASILQAKLGAGI